VVRLDERALIGRRRYPDRRGTRSRQPAHTKNLFDLLRVSRPNDRPPLYCLNQVGIRRAGINAERIRQAIESNDRNHSVRSADVGSAANNAR